MSQDKDEFTPKQKILLFVVGIVMTMAMGKVFLGADLSVPGLMSSAPGSHP